MGGRKKSTPPPKAQPPAPSGDMPGMPGMKIPPKKDPDNAPETMEDMPGMPGMKVPAPKKPPAPPRKRLDAGGTR
jgi:hypothetical protein